LTVYLVRSDVNLLVVSGPASRELGEAVAKRIGLDAVRVESKLFPDGECYVRLESDVNGEDVVIVQSTYPPQNTHLVQLLLLADLVKKRGAREVIAVVPYLAYARQDKSFRPYEGVSIETVLGLLKCVGVKSLVTVDVHTPEVFAKAGFPCKDLPAVGVLAEHLSTLGLKQPIAFAPDVKALRMAKKAAEILGGEYGNFRKERDRVTGEIKMSPECKHSVDGKDVIVFDDIISSGSTMATAVKMLKEMGARRVFSACTHPLLTDDVHRRILDSGAVEVVGTDTVSSAVSVVSVSPLIADAVSK
jgi:ribose-phosphate pyrophosphokinase